MQNVNAKMSFPHVSLIETFRDKFSGNPESFVMPDCFCQASSVMDSCQRHAGMTQ